MLPGCTKVSADGCIRYRKHQADDIQDNPSDSSAMVPRLQALDPQDQAANRHRETEYW